MTEVAALYVRGSSGSKFATSLVWSPAGKFIRKSTSLVDWGEPEESGIRTGTDVDKATDEDVPSGFTGKPSKLSPLEFTTKLSESSLN